jgi:hypothetical protein
MVLRHTEQKNDSGSRRFDLGCPSLPEEGRTNASRTAAKKSRVVKRLREESESAGLHHGSLGGSIFMGSDEGNPRPG